MAAFRKTQHLTSLPLLLAVALAAGNPAPDAFAKPTVHRPPTLSPALEAPKATPAPAPYAAGDQAFQERHIPARAQAALTLFREYHAQNPQDPEAAWRHSMGCYFAGLHLVKSDDERETLFAEGREAGLAAINLKSNCAPCHFWTAINMALYGQTVGVFKMFFTLASIREHLKSSAQVDPAYAGAGAYRLLGLIEHKLPGILGGSNDAAKKYFEQAIAIAPDEQLNYLFLMKLLRDKFDDVPAAREIAKKGVSQPKPTPDRIESVGSLKELEDFLKEHPDAADPKPGPSPSANPSSSTP